MVRSRLVLRNVGKPRNVGSPPGRTSMRFEPELWDALGEICLRENINLDELVCRAVQAYPGTARTSAVRVFAVSYFRSAAPLDIRSR
jgi:predicted DNA-binding ribbon-helix-helix protein